MIRTFAAWLVAAGLLLIGAAPAAAGPFAITRFLHPASVVVSNPSSPDVLPGSGANNAVFNSIAPASHGNPGDTGYAVRGWCRPDNIPLEEVGQSGVNGTRHFGFSCAHESSDAELAAGIGNNIDHLLVRVDGGSWFTIPAQSANPDASGLVDWNFTVNSQNYPTDGLHRADIVAVPTTGPDVVNEGPLEDAGHYWMAKISAATISDGAGGAGNILTITGTVANYNGATGTAAITDGWSLSGFGVGPNTFVDKTNADDATLTGTGGAGTYHVTGPPQLVASTPMEVGIEKSFYFVTDFNNTLNRGTHVVYASKSGSDANSGLDAAHPKLNPSSAAAVITSQDTNATKKGKWGGTVCLMDGGFWTSDAGTGSQPDASLGFLTYQGADQAPCVHPGDTGTPKLHFDVSSRTYGGLRVRYRWMTFDKAGPSTFNGGLATQLVVEHVNMVGTMYGPGLLGTGGLACLDSQLFFTSGDGCDAPISRGSTYSYVEADFLHGPELALGNTGVGGGPVLEWATGTSTLGSNVITGVTVPAGYTIGQIFPTGGNCWSDGVSCMNLTSTGVEVNCFPSAQPSPTSTSETVITSIDEVAHTITVSKAATASCVGHLYIPGAHGDLVQLTTGIFGDVIYKNNALGVTYPGYSQGWFPEVAGISGIYLEGNTFQNGDGTPESIILAGGGNEHTIYVRNVFNSPGSYRQDNGAASKDSTYLGDTCPQGAPTRSAFVGTGTGIRSKAAATGVACYVTAP